MSGSSGELSVRLKPFDQLSPTELERWEEFRGGRPEYRSPFFSVRFSQAVHRVRQDVEVAVVTNGDRPVGFLPLHRIGRRAFPAGRFLNDAHNVISSPDVTIDWFWLLEQLPIASFDFHALVGEDSGSFPEHTCHETVRSFRCEIGEDPVAYLAGLSHNHKTIGRQNQKTRKLAREVGEVTFEFDCRSPELLRQAIQWKRDQYHRTSILDLFVPDWTRQLMEELFSGAGTDLSTRNEPRGILSVLRAGEHIVAMHYGLLEQGLLHYWFPAYDPRFSRYSPGTALFRKILEQAGQNQLNCIDMGYGEQPYKLKQTDAVGEVAQGCLTNSAVYRHYRCAGTHAASILRQVPGKEAFKWMYRKLLPTAGMSKLK
ncbi:MAG: GNAT family N-acetyltransferase [Planctomycetota bacterium]